MNSNNLLSPETKKSDKSLRKNSTSSSFNLKLNLNSKSNNSTCINFVQDLLNLPTKLKNASYVSLNTKAVNDNHMPDITCSSNGLNPNFELYEKICREGLFVCFSDNMFIVNLLRYKKLKFVYF